MTVSVDSAIGVLGVDLDGTTVSAAHDQGMEVNTRDGRAIYAKAPVAAPRGSLCVVAPTSTGASVRATLASTGNFNSAAGALAINQVSIAASSWGWFYTEHNYGVVRAAVACQPFVPIYTTTTGGVVDDAVVSTGRIEGLRVHTSATSASAPVASWHNLTRITQDIA